MRNFSRWGGSGGWGEGEGIVGRLQKYMDGKYAKDSLVTFLCVHSIILRAGKFFQHRPE